MLQPCIRPVISPCLEPAISAGGAASTPPVTLLHWEFDEGTGTDIAAITGPAGTLDADQWGTGIVGAFAADLNLSEGNSDSTIAFGAEVLTVSLWVYSNSGGGELVSCPSALGSYFNLSLHASSVLKVSISGGGGQLEESADFTNHVGKWTHVSVVLDNSTTLGEIKIYINGVLQADNRTVDTKNASGVFTTDSIKIGNNFVPAFDGLVDDLRIYGEELDSSEINDLITAAPTVITDLDGNPILGLDGELIFSL